VESAFRENIPDDCRLIETFRFEPRVGNVHLELHLNRMCDTARKLGFPFNRAQAVNLCDTVASYEMLRCRLTLGRDGKFELSSQPIEPTKPRWRIAISDTLLSKGDPWLAHKTTQRKIYDDARARLPDGIDEFLFFNNRNELCEGTITNVFVALESGAWVTPPISSGCLPGILRQTLIKSGFVTVKAVSRQNLVSARQIKVGNSLRGLIDVELKV
jgi:4-amino-4-deoxychorismate lyase